MNDFSGDNPEQAALRELLRTQPQPKRNQREVTRLLCAQAYLGGSAFRNAVLQFYARNHDAVAPELGVDARLVVKVCLAAQRKHHAQNMAFCCLAALVSLAWLVEIPAAIALLLLISAVIYARGALSVDDDIDKFAKGAFDYDACTTEHEQIDIPSDIEGALPHPDQNLVMYRDFLPFVGAGDLDGGWSFNCSLDNPGTEGCAHLIAAFSVVDLYRHIEKSLVRLHLPGLHFKHQLFVRGTEARAHAALFSLENLRPVQLVPNAWIDACMYECDERMRHYLCIQIADWGGEVITSFYLRFVLQGNGLYVDSNRYFLGPVSEAMRSVDRRVLPTVATRINMFLSALFIGPGKTAVALPVAIGTLIGMVKARSSLRKRRARLNREPNYNFGAATSMRTWASTDVVQSYFQHSDVDFNRKLIERNLLDEIANFLQQHGIDSTDIRERRTTILNNGILVQGGNVQADTLAVGQGAQANKRTTRTKG